jgi:hypothetical protein
MEWADEEAELLRDTEWVSFRGGEAIECRPNP